MSKQSIQDAFKAATEYTPPRIQGGVMDRDTAEGFGFEAAQAHAVYKQSVNDVIKAHDDGIVTDEAEITTQLLVAKTTLDVTIRVLNRAVGNATNDYDKKMRDGR